MQAFLIYYLLCGMYCYFVCTHIIKQKQVEDEIAQEHLEDLYQTAYVHFGWDEDQVDNIVPLAGLLFGFIIVPLHIFSKIEKLFS